MRKPRRKRYRGLRRLIELQPHEENDYNNITTKMVITWKKREEKGGWFRRARLVARQFRWSIDVEDSFAPTSLEDALAPGGLLPRALRTRSSMSRMLS